MDEWSNPQNSIIIYKHFQNVYQNQVKGIALYIQYEQFPVNDLGLVPFVSEPFKSYYINLVQI